MEYSEWEPIYKQILADFDFDRNKDEEAALVLRELLSSKKQVQVKNIAEMIEDKELFIFGTGPSLEKDIESSEFKGIIVAADGATSALMKFDIIPDLIVTDLDGYIPDQIKANNQGAKTIIHAHGDNVAALKQWVPKFKNNILGTTQAQPDEQNKIFNFGGFTDGDRAVFLGAHFKARRINLVAFNFKEVGEYSFKFDLKMKLRKLTWANLLIGMVQEPPVVFQVDQEE